MGKTILYDKLQEVVIGAFGKDASGLSADEVMARINANAVEVDSTNADDINNDTGIDNVDNKADTVDDNNDTNDTNDINDDTVDDIVDNDTDDNNDNGVDDVITISEVFKAHFNIEEFDEDFVINYVESIKKERDDLLKEKDEMLINSFIKEKGITKDIYESLKGENLKEKEESYKKVSKLSGFKLNSNSGNIDQKELNLYKAY